MTLVLNVGVGGLLAAVTSDTRQVMRFKFGSYEKNWRVEDSEGKASLLTNCVLFAGGGYNELVHRIKDELAKKVEPTDDLIACHVKLGQVIDEVVNRSDEFNYALDDDYFAQVVLTGFTGNWQSGHSAYMLGTGESPQLKIYSEGGIDGVAVAPSEDHMKVIAEHMGVFRPRDVSTVLNDTVGMMATIHQTLNLVNSDEVSETCNYVVLYRDLETGQLQLLDGSLNIGGGANGS